MRKTVTVAALTLLLAHGALAGALRERMITHARKNFPEYLELLAIPNIPEQQADIQRNAAFLESALRKRGF